LTSLDGIADSIVVIDSFSSDNTVQIAKDYGARVVQHAFVNQAQQFNWALTQLDNNTNWVLRIDADEYLTSGLNQEIKSKLSNIKSNINGIYCNRRMSFQGRIIKYGGVFPVQVLRLFKFGYGECENRWMDEHIKVIGETEYLQGEIIDDNLNSLTWWTEKHNNYATREAVDLLNLEYNFNDYDSIASFQLGKKIETKRWVKEVIYMHLPSGIRAFLYFIYRYIVCFGFLDGKAGANFHFLQGFWYRYLVDAKVGEVKIYMKRHNTSIEEAIGNVLGDGYIK
jgi:glycosyltransferase involved in cell wall biosynthesis